MPDMVLQCLNIVSCSMTVRIGSWCYICVHAVAHDDFSLIHPGMVLTMDEQMMASLIDGNLTKSNKFIHMKIQGDGMGLGPIPS